MSIRFIAFPSWRPRHDNRDVPPLTRLARLVVAWSSARVELGQRGRHVVAQDAQPRHRLAAVVDVSKPGVPGAGIEGWPVDDGITIFNDRRAAAGEPGEGRPRCRARRVNRMPYRTLEIIGPSCIVDRADYLKPLVAGELVHQKRAIPRTVSELYVISYCHGVVRDFLLDLPTSQYVRVYREVTVI